MKRFVVALLLIGALFLSLIFEVKAITADECQQKSGNDKINCLNDLVNATKGRANTLTNEIAKLNANIALTTAKVQKTLDDIKILGDEIDSLSTKIDLLEVSLSHISNVLLERIVVTYKQGEVEPFHLLLTANGFSDFLTKLKYIRVVQAHDKRMMFEVQATKDTFTDQKNAREDKKAQQEKLRQQLEAQKIQLAQQIKDKQALLEITKNNEAIYQNLLEKARQELAGFSAFTQFAGGGLTNFGNGSNGWYYTQRDPQWGNMLLPGSSSSLLLAGCAVTSVAMVCKSYGQGITPANIASDSNNFFYGDLWNWAFSCSGKTASWIGSSQDQVKSYVKNNTPVILRLIAPSVSGLHFIVAFAWDDGKNDFKIHDPYYGPDKYFSDRYSWSQVTTSVVIH